MRMLHPIMPFITEEIWTLLPHKRDSIMVRPWPHLQKDLIDKKAEGEMDLAVGVITAIRNIRAEVNIPPQKSCKAIVSTEDAKTSAILNGCLEYIKSLAKVEDLQIGKNIKRPKASSTTVFGDCEIAVPLEGLIDLESERKRIMGQIADIEKWLRSTEAKLKNDNFIKRAPKEVVEAEKAKLSEIKVSLDKLKENLKRIES